MNKNKIIVLLFSLFFLLAVNIDIKAYNDGDEYSFYDRGDSIIVSQGEVILITGYDSCEIAIFEEIYCLEINGNPNILEYEHLFQIRNIPYTNGSMVVIEDELHDPWEDVYLENIESTHCMRVCVDISTTARYFYVNIYREYVDGQYVYDFSFRETTDITLPEFVFNDYMLEFFIENFDNENLNTMHTVTNIKDFTNDPSVSQTTTVNVNKSVAASYYFTNLKNNFPLNDDGSCTIIASEILLSYYDIFYNSDIVYDECYGQKMITPVNVTSTTLSNCTNSPGPSNVFNEMMKVEVSDYANLDFSDGNYGMNEQETYTFLSTYMTHFCDYGYDNSYDIAYLSNETQILNELDQGRPIILLLRAFAFEDTLKDSDKIKICDGIRIFNAGHAVVCYGYEKMANGEIYYKCHTGYHNDVYRIRSSTLIKSLSTVSGYSIRLLSNSHVHSTSYISSEGPICPCYTQANYLNALDISNEESLIYEIILDGFEYILIKEEEDETI